MPSYRYIKDIKPEDLQPEAPPPPSPADKRKNWWHYHWKLLLVALAAAALVVFFIVDVTTQTKPDLTIGVVAPYSLPEELVALLEEQLAAYTEDVNGDGKVVVFLDVYTVEVTAEGEESAADPNMQMAGVVRLHTALQTEEPLIYLADPEYAEAYQETFGLFGLRSEGAEEDPLASTVAFGDVPGLAAMDLNFEIYGGGALDGQDILKEFRLGLRPLTPSLQQEKEGTQRWQRACGVYQALLAGLA